MKRVQGEANGEANQGCKGGARGCKGTVLRAQRAPYSPCTGAAATDGPSGLRIPQKPKGKGLQRGCAGRVCACSTQNGGRIVAHRNVSCLKLGWYVADEFITVKFSVGAAKPESHGSKRAGVQLP